MASSEAEDTETAGDGTRDHGGIIDIEKIPGGSVLTGVRAELADKYEPYLTLDKTDKETVRRWGTGSIVSHWIVVLCMLIAIVSGVAFWTGWYGPMDIGVWDGYQTAFILHVWSGVILAVFALVVFPFYHKVVDGHKLLVTPGQIKEEIVIALSFVGLMRYMPGYKNARRSYDTDEKEWIGYHPMQTVFWYVTWFFVLVLTLSGFALWEALATDPAWWLSALGFMEGWVTYETMLLLHLVAMFWVIAAIAIHAYFAVMPSNVDFLKSMVYGTVDAWILDEESRPDRGPPAEEPVEEETAATDAGTTDDAQ